LAKTDRWSGTIELLACDIANRPEAPGSDELRPHVIAVVRESESIVIKYRTEAMPLFAKFAAAERVCCSGLRWDLEDEGGPQLRISASPAQLDALGPLFAEE
jgi:hypothetical protein